MGCKVTTFTGRLQYANADGYTDDDVFNTLDLYMADLIPREEAIKRLRKKKPNWQICLCNQQLIDKHLHFVESIELKNDAS